VNRPVTVRVPAKVNVFLGVGPKEFSGFHELATVFQSVSVYDEITVTPSEQFSITVEGRYADQIPTDSSNLVWKAAHLIAQACGEDPQVNIHINKKIPIAAGMAGGSADAAATLVACDVYWGAELGRDQLDAMAMTLGSDVPFMLHGGCALGTGRGDVLSPIMTRGHFNWVFATFEQGLSTAQVYDRTDALRGPDFDVYPAVPSDVLSALAQGDTQALGRALHNDLAASAVTMRPRLQDVLDYGRESGALGALISGSGPTCAFLVADESAAINLVVALGSSGLVDHAFKADGPVHGPRVVPTLS
jgi:4-diphosphocytidyl-2-C-methyl-D-erythritol kinase